MPSNIAFIGFIVAGGAYSLLFLQLLNSWRGRLPGGILLAASGLTATWAFVSAYSTTSGLLETGLLTVLDASRLLAWILFLALLLGFRGPNRRSPIDSTAWGALLIAVTCAVAGLLQMSTGRVLFIPGIGTLSHIGFLSLSVMGLVLVEQLYRNSREDRRWAIKFLCIGLGGLFAYDFFLYSQALLQQHTLPAVAAARGIIVALVVPLLAISIARNPDWSLNVFVSRRLALHSAALLGSGIYLLVMAAGGYYLRFYGGTWGTVAQLTFLFGALLLLLVILFSGRSRATLKVFLGKHFFRYKYDYREEWQRLTNTLSAPQGQLKERAIRALAQIVESPAGALWLRQDSGVLLPTAHWNLADYQAVPEPLESPLARFCEEHRWIIDLNAYRNDPEHYQGLQLPTWLVDNSRHWLIIPLLHHRHLQGFVLLTQPRAPHRLTWEDFDLLKAAASQVTAHVAQQETQNALLESRQFEAYNQFSTFVVHDLKNLIAQLSLLVSNAARHRNNPEFLDDAVETIDHSIDKMQRLLRQLRRGGLPDTTTAVAIDLCELAKSVAQRQAQRRPAATIGDCRNGLTIKAEAGRLEGVVAHIVENAQEATPDSGTVTLRVYRDRAYGVIEVTDTGNGMDALFIEQDLFRPFLSTKGSKGMGIGAYQARTLLRSLGGDIEVSSTPGQGSCFRLLFPCPQSESADTATNQETTDTHAPKEAGDGQAQG